MKFQKRLFGNKKKKISFRYFCKQEKLERFLFIIIYYNNNLSFDFNNIFKCKKEILVF